MRKFFISLIFVVFFGVCHAADFLDLNFEGPLSSDKLQVIKEEINRFQGKEIMMRIDSGVGAFNEVLSVAQQLYALKVSRGVKITAYISHRALGPAAILPLLADVWIGSASFLWGDIGYSAEFVISKSQLISDLQGLILNTAPNASQLKLIAHAMIDPSVTLIKRQGTWVLMPMSVAQERLVLTRAQLLDMGIYVQTMTHEQFDQKYGISPHREEAINTSAIDKKLAEHIHYNPLKDNLVGYIYFGRDRPIDQSSYLYTKFALEEYRKRGVIFVIVHLDTPGGEVFPSVKIAELLQEFDTKYHIPVVAVIRNWALSAGAMIAYACRFIGVSENALMGAAEPIISGHEGKMESAPEKIVSALRSEFGSLAKFYGRNPLLAEAMVDKDILLVIRQGQIVRLNSPQEIQVMGKDPDELVTGIGKLLTLDAEQLLGFGIADFMIPTVAPISISEYEKEVGQWPAKQSELFQYHFFKQIPYGTIIQYQNWKIDFYAFLTHPLIASLLMMGLMIGFYMEMSHPGFGLPGMTALVCLGLILLSSFALETINWLEILFVGVGILLLLTEIFILPGFGVAGVLGILLILFGLFAMLLPDFAHVQWSWNSENWNLPTIEFMHQLTYNLGALFLSLLIIAILARYVTPRLLKKSRLVLNSEAQDNVPTPPSIALPPVESQGEAFTSLRPGGKVLINNHLYDAISEGNFIEQGTKVVVIKIQGSAIVVDKIEKSL